MNEGCPNCEDLLQLKSSPDAIAECTSAQFEGVITMGDPKTSWVAKWKITEYNTYREMALRLMKTELECLRRSIEVGHYCSINFTAPRRFLVGLRSFLA